MSGECPAGQLPPLRPVPRLPHQGDEGKIGDGWAPAVGKENTAPQLLVSPLERCPQPSAPWEQLPFARRCQSKAGYLVTVSGLGASTSC